MDLSLCMIVKNEEASLPQTLNSVKTIVDEMIVLDTGSTDRTVEVAKQLGAEVHHFPWCNDFATARNEALKYVRGKWVLVLDADEVLMPEIVPQIKEAIKNDRYLVINLIRYEVGAAQCPFSLVSRLFRNHPEVSFSRPYHAMVDDSVEQLLQQEPQWQVVTLSSVAMRHYGYQQAAIASLDKYNRAQTAMEGYLATYPDDPYVCSKLGALYVEMNQVERGKELLQRGLNSEGLEPGLLFELNYHLGNVYTRLDDLDAAARHYQEAILQPILPQLKLSAYNNLGNLLLSVGDLTTARKAYETTLQLDPDFAVGHNNLGMTLKAMGEFALAIASYQKAIASKPDYADAYQNLGVVLLKVGKVPESLSAFKSAIALHTAQDNTSEAQRLCQGLQDMGFHV
jgi:glycosyltransferase involved in cell wall biosynthesis